ncbi:MAG: formate transporter FocA, partial [Rhodospirillales bacterium]
MNAKNPYDAYTPAEIADHIENIGVRKVNLPDMKILVLAILAGAFIALGAMFYTLVITKSGLGFGPERILG